jgi:hypothetical protein
MNLPFILAQMAIGQHNIEPLIEYVREYGVREEFERNFVADVLAGKYKIDRRKAKAAAREAELQLLEASFDRCCRMLRREGIKPPTKAQFYEHLEQQLGIDADSIRRARGRARARADTKRK